MSYEEIIQEILNSVKKDSKYTSINVYQKGIERDIQLEKNEEQRNILIKNIYDVQFKKKYLCYRVLTIDILKSLEDEDLQELYYHYYPASKIKLVIK